MERSIESMTAAIGGLLAENRPSVYLYGSCVLGDFKMGWSDIDILVLLDSEMSPEGAEELVGLRQKMLAREPVNRYYRLFEGGMLTLSALCGRSSCRVVYWGTSGQRITDRYEFDSFSMFQLLKNGRLLLGEDVRDQLKAPSFDELRRDVWRHYDTIRKYAKKTERSFYSFGWLLDIARGLYTLATGEVIAKTAAGRWALEQGICPVPNSMELALNVRERPERYIGDKETFDLAERLGPEIQKFADVLERALDLTAPERR